MPEMTKINAFGYMKNLSDSATKEAITQLLLKHSSALPKINDIWFDDDFDVKRNGDVWYSGSVACILLDGQNFTVEATGEQRYNLYVRDRNRFVELYPDKIQAIGVSRMSESHPVEEFVNKGDRSRTFFYQFKSYFDSDEAFGRLTEGEDAVFALECNNNNWLEITCYDTKEKRCTNVTDLFKGDIGCYVLEEFEYILENLDMLIAQCAPQTHN